MPVANSTERWRLPRPCLNASPARRNHSAEQQRRRAREKRRRRSAHSRLEECTGVHSFITILPLTRSYGSRRTTVIRRSSSRCRWLPPTRSRARYCRVRSAARRLRRQDTSSASRRSPFRADVSALGRVAHRHEYRSRSSARRSIPTQRGRVTTQSSIRPRDPIHREVQALAVRPTAATR